MSLTYLKIRRLPTPVLRELESIALEDTGGHLNQAVGLVLLSISKEVRVDEEGGLTGAIGQGISRIPEFRKSQKHDRGVHIPGEAHAALKESAQEPGIRVGDAVRHVLVGRAGSLAALVKDGLVAS